MSQRADHNSIHVIVGDDDQADLSEGRVAQHCQVVERRWRLCGIPNTNTIHVTLVHKIQNNTESKGGYNTKYHKQTKNTHGKDKIQIHNTAKQR